MGDTELPVVLHFLFMMELGMGGREVGLPLGAWKSHQIAANGWTG
jgi:hypothetical protein